MSCLKEERTHILIQSVSTKDDKITIVYQNDRDLSNISILDLDYNGSTVDNYTVKFENSYDIKRIDTKRKGNGLLIYGKFIVEPKSNASNGIFVGEIQNKALQYVNFINYLDIPSFNGVFSEKKQKMLQRKINSAQNKNKNLFIELYGPFPNIYPTPFGYVLIFERDVIFVNNFNKITEIQPTQIFALGFDNNGKLKWDNYLNIQKEGGAADVLKIGKQSSYDDLKLSIHNENSNFGQGFVEKQNMNLFWRKYNYVKVKTFDLESGTVLNESGVLRSIPQNDKIPSIIQRSMMPTIQFSQRWYDNFVIISGNEKTNDKVEVLYVEKIELK
ncbi:MAG: hypothetical protein QM751_11105 [Paludibacteraceae bacterium]